MEKTKYDGNKTVAWADVGWQPKEITAAPIGTIKLSEAMRIGAGLRGQCKGDLFKHGMSCALGAAYEGKTGRTCGRGDYDLVQDAFPVLGKPYGPMSDIGKDIYRRNDNGDSREAIADWLESKGY